jgi:hypothetical protein
MEEEVLLGREVEVGLAQHQLHAQDLGMEPDRIAIPQSTTQSTPL